MDIKSQKIADKFGKTINALINRSPFTNVVLTF